MARKEAQPANCAEVDLPEWWRRSVDVVSEPNCVPYWLLPSPNAQIYGPDASQQIRSGGVALNPKTDESIDHVAEVRMDEEFVATFECR